MTLGFLCVFSVFAVKLKSNERGICYTKNQRSIKTDAEGGS